MKKRNKVIATFIALCVLVGAIGPVNLFDTTDTVEAAYTMNKTYDATEEYFKLQKSPYSYNGYKMAPFTTCNDWLSTRPDGGTKIGEGMSVVTGGNVKQGDKLVIEFKEPIDSREFEVITLTMKQVPGNSYYAYNSTDKILSTVRKSFSFSTYELEKVSFQTALFADSKGYVNAIILQNTKAENSGQLFIDSFTVSASPYEKEVIYDATGDYLAQQSASSYKGISVIPFGHRSTFWTTDAKIDSDEGYALFSSKYVNNKSANLSKGDILVLEFVNDINAKQFKYINLTFATSTKGGAKLEFYNAYDISNSKLGKVKANGDVNFWSFATVSLKSSDFADSDGYVNAVAMKLTSSEAATFSVGAFSLSDTPKSATPAGSGNSASSGMAEGLIDTKNQYDGTDKNFVLQSSEEYNGIKILPLSEYNDYLSQKADGGKGMGEGYALFTSRFAKAGDVVVLEFVTPIDSKKSDLLTLSLKHVPGNNWSVYKISDTSFVNAIKTFDVGSYNIEKLALRTKFFADSDGMVRGIMLKLNNCELEGQLFVDGYSLSNDPYQLGVTYDMTEEYVKVQTAGNYKGMTTAVFNERSTFWEKEAKRETDTGYALVAHKADGKALSKGDVLILEFVTDISADKFEILNLTLATSSKKGATFEVYSVNDIKNGKLGEMKQKVEATYWDFGTNSLPLASYADAQGYVSAIALKLVSDEAATFSIGAFSLATLDSLVKKGSPEILDNKITFDETENTYDFLIEFNKTGSIANSIDEDVLGDFVYLNGIKVSDINAKNKFVQIEWQSIGRYYLQVSVDKKYVGDGEVINTDKLFVGNCIELAEGMEFPNGDKLTQSYALHVYSVDSITDVRESEKEYAPISVTRISSRIDANEDLQIDVYFNNAITGSTLYYVCNPDSFNRKSVAALGEKYYNEDVAAAIAYGGYKSSLLDNLEINGYNIAEWLAIDELSGSAAYNSAIMVHYGMAGNKVATIIVSKISDIGQTLKESYSDGDLSITFNEGLKFVSDKEIKETVSYKYVDEVWSKMPAGDFAVYYDGTKVENDDYITVDKAVRASNISIIGDGEYEIQEKISGNVATYTIISEGDELLSFQVEGEEVIPVQTENNNIVVAIISGVVSLLGIVVIITLYIHRQRRKKNAKEIEK